MTVTRQAQELLNAVMDKSLEMGHSGGNAMKAAIEAFLAESRLALVGASRREKKFGNYVLAALMRKGYQVILVNPHADSIDGERCYPSLNSLPMEVGGVILVVPPGQTEKLVREVAAVGIRRVWMQQGAESDDAIRFCETNGISVIHGECILMFARPVDSFHRLHRWICGVFGRMPK